MTNGAWRGFRVAGWQDGREGFCIWFKSPNIGGVCAGVIAERFLLCFGREGGATGGAVT